jgi:hypothetical protein
MLQGTLLAVACALPVGIFILLRKFAVNMPQWDEWAVSILIVKLHQHVLTFHDLWEQHNEHRMLVAYSLMLLLAKAGGGWNIIREVCFNLFLVILAQMFFFELLKKSFRGTALAVAFLFVSLCLYATMQAENWLWGFQIAWFLVELLLVIQVWLLTRYPLATGAYWLSIIVSFLASYTMSSGLDLWIVGFVILWMHRKEVGSHRISIWVAAAISAVVIYLHGWSPTGLQSHPSYVLTHPIEFFAYLFTYFGNGFGGWSGMMFAMVLGAVALMVYGLLALAYLRKPEQNVTDPEVAWIAIGIFSLLTAGMTDVGRLGFGIDQATASRYTTCSDLLWISAFVLTLRYWLPKLHRMQFRVLAGMAAAIFAFLYYRASLGGLSMMHEIHNQDTVSLKVLKTYATANDDALHVIFPDATALRTFAGDLQSVHDGPFHP